VKARQLLPNSCTLRASLLKSVNSEIKTKHVVGVSWADRWQVYQRLQELGIPCWCEANQPLTAEINNPTAAIQLWSVMQRFTLTRQELIWTLEHSWRLNLEF
jgi:hypothetical protein